MFHGRSLSTRFLIPALFVVVAGGIAVLAARSSSDDAQAPQSPAREAVSTGPAKAASRFRNLSFQPEAARLGVKLGQRFTGSDSDVSVLIGEVVTNETRVPVRIIRRQDKRGESVEITRNGKSLAWTASPGSKASSFNESDRSLIERVVFDSADAFVLAQLRGASYQVVAKNVRADLDGADNYDGPLWTVVRVGYSGADIETKPETPFRFYYINSRTGLLDKVISEVQGEEVVATLEDWITEGGETFPSVVRWSIGGRQIMEFKVITFVRPNAK